MKLSDKRGFSLLEVAIVLTIVGLLTAGIMKGAELYKSAKLLAQVGQFQKIRSGIKHFQDLYGTWPSDVTQAECLSYGWADSGDTTGTTCSNNSSSRTGRVLRSPYNSFWLQLARGTDDIITENMIPGNKQLWEISAIYNFNGTLSFFVYYRTTFPIFGTTRNNYMQSSINALKASEAKFIDSKIDDGIAYSGFMYANGSLCSSGTSTPADYGAGTNPESKNACGICIFMDLW